jgi:hypothetical protein
VIQLLPSKCKALGSVLSTTKIRGRGRWRRRYYLPKNVLRDSGTGKDFIGGYREAVYQEIDYILGKVFII